MSPYILPKEVLNAIKLGSLICQKFRSYKPLNWEDLYALESDDLIRH